MNEKTIPRQGARASGGNFMRPVRPDSTLSRITGPAPLPFSEVSRRVWDYIRQNGLQDRERKVMINADEKLGAVFNGKRHVTIFEMLKLVAGHVAA
jgi:upstream activation factor subunit UAF30